jgi:hypothetical protein
MPDNTTLLLYIIFGLSGVFALFCIGRALYLGLTQRYGLLFWRKIKLASSLFAVIGLVLLILNFEKVVRDTVGGKSRDYAFAEFVDLKFYIARELALLCANADKSPEAQRNCDEAINLDKYARPHHIRNSTKYGRMQHWDGNDATVQLVENANRYFARIDSALPAAALTESFIDDDKRMGLLVLAIILVILSIAGSVGEAAFQLAQTRAGEQISQKGKT